MSKYDKLFIQIMSGNSDSNIEFSDLQKILTLLGFVVRIKGDHFIYFKEVLRRSSTFSLKETRQNPIRSSR